MERMASMVWLFSSSCSYCLAGRCLVAQYNEVALCSAAHQLEAAPRGFFVVKSAAWQLLESFSDQLLKLLRLRGVSLHLVLSKLRLKHQNVLEGLCVADLAGERELTRHSASPLLRHV